MNCLDCIILRKIEDRCFELFKERKLIAIRRMTKKYKINKIEYKRLINVLKERLENKNDPLVITNEKIDKIKLEDFDDLNERIAFKWIEKSIDNGYNFNFRQKLNLGILYKVDIRNYFDLPFFAFL